MNNHSAPSPMLGQLLVRAQVIEQQVLKQALEKSRNAGLKVGQVLLYSGLVAENVLRAALAAQKLVRQNRLLVKHATEALYYVHKRGVDLAEALTEVRRSIEREYVFQFARILEAAKLVDPRQMSYVLNLSTRSKFPLGRLVTLLGMTDGTRRRMILDAVILVRCGEVTFEHAVAAVKAALRTGRKFYEVLGIEASPTKVLSIELRESGILPGDEITDIIEESLRLQSLWQASFITDNLVDNLRFTATMVLNHMLSSGELAGSAAETRPRSQLQPAPVVSTMSPGMHVMSA